MLNNEQTKQHDINLLGTKTFRTTELDTKVSGEISTRVNSCLPGERRTRLTTDREVLLKKNAETLLPTIVKLSLLNSSLVRPTYTR